MADINLFSRLSNLWTGFVSLWVADVEKEHPEIAYENAINNATTRFVQLRNATAALIRRRDELTGRREKAQSELSQVVTELEAAIIQNDRELGAILLQKKKALDAELAELAIEAQSAGAEADDAKSSLLGIQADINKLKAERDRMLAQFKSAKARLAIQEQMDGLSIDATVQALDKVRDHIKNTTAEARLGGELRNSDIDVRLQKLRASSGAVTAQSEFDQLVKARATTGQQAAAGKQL
jgi:phage shock protein A